MRTCAFFRALNRALGKTVGFFVLISFPLMGQPSSNPYLVIAYRNVFGLKAPEVPERKVADPPPRVMPVLVLNGVVDFSSAKWALISRTDPGRPAKNYTLEPGEVEEGVQLISLDADKATATVRVDGIDTLVLRLGSNSNSKPFSPPQLSGVRKPSLPPMTSH